MLLERKLEGAEEGVPAGRTFRPLVRCLRTCEKREREREARKQWDGPGLVIRRNAQTMFLARGESECLEPIEAARGFLRFLTTT